jgi:hypothetical protein
MQVNRLGADMDRVTAVIAGRAGSRFARRLICAATFTTLAACQLAPGAQAAPSWPTVQTGGAVQVSYGSATLTGRVEPHGSITSYYFQYGPTKAYGQQTAVADVAANVGAQSVSVAVSGLEPVTTYHYRLVAVNAIAAETGKDATLMTTKVPLSLQILVAPNPVAFGGAVTVQGTLSGTDNGGRAVVLQANPFPYLTGFTNVGNPELTSPTGSFSFPVLGLTEASQFRVATTTKPPVISPTASEAVAVQVSAHVAHARRRHEVRIYGTVSPAVNGMEVGIMRVERGRNVLVAGTVLRARNATSSRFGRVVRVRPGLYRVLVRVTNGALTSNYSEPLLIR